MDVSVVQDFDEYLELLTGADHAIDHSHPGALFASPRFCRAYWSVYGPELQLFALVIRQDQKVAGLLPLVASSRDRKRNARQHLEILGANACDFSYFPGSDNPAVLRALLTYLRQGREWKSIRFPFVGGKSGLMEAGAAIAREAGIHVHAVTADVNHWLDLETDQAAEVAKPNKTMRKKIKRLRRVADLELIEHRDPESIASRLPHLMDLHVARWSGTDTPSKFLNRPSRDLYYQITSELGSDGVVLFELRWSDRSIAYVFGFTQERRYLLYTAAFDRTLQPYSPGALLNYLIVQHLIESGSCSSVDHMRGDESYKLELSSDHKILWEVRWYARTLDWLLRSFAIAARRRVKQMIMRVPAVHRWVEQWRRSSPSRGAPGST